MTVESLGRAVGMYRRTATSRSAIVLLIANAIPIVGVLFFGWSLLTILVLYWLENGIVGFWNVPRIALAQGSALPTLPELPEGAAFAATGSAAGAASLREAWRQAREAQLQQQQRPVAGPGTAGTAGIAAMGPAMGLLNKVSRIGLAIFFTFHYGVFWLVHGIFVFALPAFGNGFGLAEGSTPCLDGSGPGTLPGGFPGVGECANTAFGEVLWGPVAIAAVALFISHGASFLLNYIGRGEYITASPPRQMAAPYARVVVLHLTIIFGSMVVAFLGAPIGALLVLVGLKTAFDLGLHLREHRPANVQLRGALRSPA